jgi:hypothetical protein
MLHPWNRVYNNFHLKVSDWVTSSPLCSWAAGSPPAPARHTKQHTALASRKILDLSQISQKEV